MKSYLYVFLFTLLLSLAFAVKVSAQTNPSGQPVNTGNTYPDNRPNYNYLGLLGLLGLYGLHKSRIRTGNVIDRKVI